MGLPALADRPGSMRTRPLESTAAAPVFANQACEARGVGDLDVCDPAPAAPCQPRIRPSSAGAGQAVTGTDGDDNGDGDVLADALGEVDGPIVGDDGGVLPTPGCAGRPNPQNPIATTTRRAARAPNASGTDLRHAGPDGPAATGWADDRGHAPAKIIGDVPRRVFERGPPGGPGGIVVVHRCPPSLAPRRHTPPELPQGVVEARLDRALPLAGPGRDLAGGVALEMSEDDDGAMLGRNRSRAGRSASRSARPEAPSASAPPAISPSALRIESQRPDRPLTKALATRIHDDRSNHASNRLWSRSSSKRVQASTAAS